jgi:hypothetical protein
MMQETQTVGPKTESGPEDLLTSQSLAALLALAGSKRLDMNGLRSRARLTPSGFGSLLSWLQREYLVDVVSTLEGNDVKERLELTDKGEQVLVSLLEKMCELPELQ